MLSDSNPTSLRQTPIPFAGRASSHTWSAPRPRRFAGRSAGLSVACIMRFAPIVLRRDLVVELVGLRETQALWPDSSIPKNRKRLGPRTIFQRRQGKNSCDQTSLEKLTDCLES